ncbi:MAG TPA: TonB-dependent receptor [Polyangiales bacterium]|jgi:outer membrane cobalamin receptor|nr:TonB-dependent receptor [Polyangiales bacterium]
MHARLTQLSYVGAWLCVSTCAIARADDAAHASAGASDYGAHAKVERPLASENREDPTAAGTEIDVRARPAAHETVDDVMLEVPGSHPLRTGWLGSFSSASLRGAEVEHTAVLLGEIPISSADGAAFDLSTIPVELLDRIAVFRGGTPLWLGQDAIGGVVQLVPRSATDDHRNLLEGTLRAGSFSTYGVSLASAVTPHDGDGFPRFSLLTAAGVLSTQGDFEYDDDRNTTFDPSDDRIVRRHNADLVEGHGLVHATSTLGPGQLELLGLGFENAGGQPGSPAAPAALARRGLQRAITGLAYTIDDRDAQHEHGVRLQALASLGLSHSRTTDLHREIGIQRQKLIDDDGSDALGRLAASVEATPFLELTLLGTARREFRSSEDPYARVATPDSTRTTFTGGAETMLHGKILSHRIELRPSVRVEHSDAVLHSEHFAQIIDTGVSDTLPTYRVALGVEAFSDLTLNASLATGIRSPSMNELFGDGLFQLGNTSLRPERSTSVEAGLVDVTCVGDFAGSFEARAFSLSIRDQVIFLRNAAQQSYPQNLNSSHVRGVELGARTTYTSHLSLNAALTLLDTEGKPGKSLPNRPRAVLFVEPGASTSPIGPFDALRFFVTLNYAANSYDDPDNATLPKPSQTFVDAGTALAFLHEHAELRVTAADVFDRGGRDLSGYPLPGRSVMASFTYKEDTL